jgi:hypothetical protein
MDIPIHDRYNSTVIEHGKLFYDKNGNIYLLFHDKYFMVIIDRHDDLGLDEIDVTRLSKTEEKIIVNEITHTYNEKSLKSKVVNSLKKDLPYFPESKFYYTEYDKQEDDEYEDDRIIISKFGEEIIKSLDCYSEVASCHDTIIIDDKVNSGNVIFTMENLNAQGYRITINTTGMFILNCIGTRFSNYELAFDKGNVNFVILFRSHYA